MGGELKSRVEEKLSGRSQPQARLLVCLKHGSGLRITAADRIRNPRDPETVVNPNLMAVCWRHSRLIRSLSKSMSPAMRE